MDLYAAQQPATSTCDHPGGTGRRCVLFGCLEAAAWIISDPQGGELPACGADLDVLLNDALPGCRWTAAFGWRSGGPELTGRRDTEPTATAVAGRDVAARHRPARFAPADPLASQMVPTVAVRAPTAAPVRRNAPTRHLATVSPPPRPRSVLNAGQVGAPTRRR
jgi:hypothetical protein